MNEKKPTAPIGVEDAYEVMEEIKKKAKAKSSTLTATDEISGKKAAKDGAKPV